ncbi:MAG: phosphate ABC transporter permease subunit PstC [Geitlerinemataceae cyanobacterium]
MTDSIEQSQNLSPNLHDFSDIDLSSAVGKGEGFELAFKGLAWTCALVSAGIFVWMSILVFKDAYPAIAEFGFSFFTTQRWSVPKLEFGALTYIYGTLVTSTIALFFAIPFGLAVAILTSENFLPNWVRSPIAFLVELIAAIPSVIIGLWGIFVLIPVLLPVQQKLFEFLGWIPLFETEPLGSSILVAGVLLSIMILPTIAAISRDVLLSIPADLRSASMALGATRWEAIWDTIIPAGSAGILGAIILALGRALGETMAVTMVIGNAKKISFSLIEPGSTIPAILANQFGEALNELHIGALMYLALILFVITLLVNMTAVFLVQAIERRSNQQ